MKSIEVFYIVKYFHFTEDFKRLVREQKRRLREIEKLYLNTNLKIPGGNVKEYYRLKLNLEHKRRKYLKMIMKEFQKFGSLYNRSKDSKAEEMINNTLNILKTREEAFNHFYQKIKIGILQ